MTNWADATVRENSVMGERLQDVANHAGSIKESNLSGLIAEAGVYKGGSAKLLATIFPDRRLLLFDSFEGMLEDDECTQGKHKKGDFGDASLESVKNLLKDNKNCEFYKGWFPKTADFLSDEEFAFVHLDMDYYQSTRDGIRIFWPRIVKGGILLLDDWSPADYSGPNDTPGVPLAFSEYFSQRNDYKILSTNCFHMLPITKT